MKNAILEQHIRLAQQARESGNLVKKYEPQGYGQTRFAKTKAHIIFLMGGNDSGKTFSALMKVAHHIIPAKDINGNYTGYTIHPPEDKGSP